MEGNGKPKNGSWIKDMNWPTVVLILATGGGNFLASKEDGRLTRAEAERVSREVHDLHSALDDFEKRQKDVLDKLDKLLDRR